MELFQEILCHILADKKVQVSFSGLTDTEVIKMTELECYKALKKSKPFWRTANAFIGLKKLSACLRHLVPAAATGMILADSIGDYPPTELDFRRRVSLSIA